jgi:hypothetical protein
MYMWHNSSDRFINFCLIILKTKKSVFGKKCTLHVSLQLLFKTLFTLMNIYGDVLRNACRCACKVFTFVHF